MHGSEVHCYLIKPPKSCSVFFTECVIEHGDSDVWFIVNGNKVVEFKLEKGLCQTCQHGQRCFETGQGQLHSVNNGDFSHK